ncbi:MAG: 4Fe-4S dicluster domain-containing protein [Thermoleophilia bacterium]
MPGHPECDRCGACRQTCMVERLGGDSITTILNGESETGAWNCSNCWKCIDACPLGADIYSAIIDRRRQEKPPATYREAFASICRVGFIFPMEEINTIREMWGLDHIRLIDPKILGKLLAGCDDDEEDPEP